MGASIHLLTVSCLLLGTSSVFMCSGINPGVLVTQLLQAVVQWPAAMLGCGLWNDSSAYS